MPFVTQQLQNFIGQGFTIPLKLTNGRPPLESGFDLIRSSIINIVSWAYGKRFFLNEYGSRLYELLEEPNDIILEDIVRVFVVDAINKWEKRIDLTHCSIVRTSDIKMEVTVTYQIINTKREDTFVFPFYTKIIY